MYTIHVTRQEQYIDLLAFTEEEYGFYTRCLTAYEANTPFNEYINLIQSRYPLLEDEQSTIQAYPAPLFTAVWDLLIRLAVRQGMIAKEPRTYPEGKPAVRDTFLPVHEAASQASVTELFILDAIRQGRLAGHQEDNGQWVVSLRSLSGYFPRTW